MKHSQPEAYAENVLLASNLPVRRPTSDEFRTQLEEFCATETPSAKAVRTRALNRARKREAEERLFEEQRKAEEAFQFAEAAIKANTDLADTLKPAVQLWKYGRHVLVALGVATGTAGVHWYYRTDNFYLGNTPPSVSQKANTTEGAAPIPKAEPL